MVQFFYITQADYDNAKAQNKIVNDHLYFIQNGKCLYRGEELIASSGEADADLIALEDAILKSNQAISANASSIESTNKLIAAHITVTDEMQLAIEALTGRVDTLENTVKNKLDTSTFNNFKTDSFDVLAETVEGKASQSALNNLVTTVNEKADASSVYTKGEIDSTVSTINTNLSKKADSSALSNYATTKALNDEISRATTKEEELVDSLALKADSSNVYTKNEVDSTVSGINTQLSGKVNTSELENYYTKAQVDKELADGLSTKLEASALEDYYTKTEVNTELGKKANTSTVEGISTKVNTLIDSDGGKSVRTIANEELAKQLITDDAVAALDTLEEIARWIQDHPEDAATMNNAIEALEELVGPATSLPQDYADILDYITKTKSNLTSSINTLEGKVATNTTNIGKKVDQTAFDTLTSKVDANTDSTQANAEAIGAKADQTALNTLSENVNNSINDLTNQNTAQDTKIGTLIDEVYGVTNKTIPTNGISRIDNILSGASKVKAAESADSATTAGSATSATKATNDGSNRNIVNTYETKTDAASKLTTAQEYAEEQAAAVQANLNALKYAGSDTVGGQANSAKVADTLSVNAGSATNPVYFENGVPVKTTYTLGKSVPSNAVFTDSHYQAFIHAGTNTSTGNTATSNGNTYINIVENSARNSGVKIVGSGATSVKSDANGTITVSSTDTNTTYDPANGTTLGLVKSGGDVSITNGEIKVTSGANHEHEISQIEDLEGELGEIDNKVPTQASVDGQVVSVKNAAGTELFNFTTQDTNTDTKVKQTARGTSITGEFPILLRGTSAGTSTTTTTVSFSSGATINPSTKKITAAGFIGDLEGNATTATTADSATKATKDGSGNTITTTYETKTNASATYETKSNASATYATKSALDALSGTVTQHSTSIGNNATAIQSNTTEINKKANQTDLTKVINELYGVTNGTIASTSRLDTLDGLVGTKSVQAQIVEEIAKIVADAPEDFDTLKEIASWIESDTTNTSVMVSNISSLIKEVYDANEIPANGNSRIDTINSKVATNETEIGNLKTDKATKDIVNKIIDELYGPGHGDHDDYPEDTNSRLDGFDTKIDTLEGTVSGHTTSIADINTALTGKASTSSVDDANTRIDSLYTELTGTATGSLSNSRLDQVIQKANDNETNIGTNRDNIAGNLTKINENITAISGLTTRVEETEENISEISGLLTWKTSM